MKNWRMLAGAFFWTTLFSPAAIALIIEIEPVMQVNASAPSQHQGNSNLSWTGNTAFGAGLLTAIEIPETPLFFQTGLVVSNSDSENIMGNTLTGRKTHGVHVPLLLRYQFDERFALGIGGYADFASGSVTTITNNTTSVLQSYFDAGIHNRDFGLLISARASIPIIPRFRFIIDGRYQHGLSNLTNIPPGTTGDFLNTRNMQAYLGVSYLLSI